MKIHSHPNDFPVVALNTSIFMRRLSTILGPRRISFALFAALGLLFCGGCRPQFGIEHSEVTLPEAVKADPKVQVKERIFGAIVPAGNDKWWFFKMMGPADVMESQRSKFDRFVESLKFPEDEMPVWIAPEGWTEQHGKGGFNIAEFRIETAKEPLKLTVSNAGGSLKGNIDRWRGQVGLEPLTALQVESSYQKRMIHGRIVLIVDLAGPGGGTGMGGMPGKLPAGHPPILKKEPATNQ
jgi:hypothetical protein